MKLIFYGGGHDFENVRLDDILIGLTQNKSPQITFIPSSSYFSEQDFREFVEQYNRHKLTRFINFPVDLPYSNVLKKEAFKSDVIHLSGGNTYYFLHHLRKSKLVGELKSFVKRGGILTGLSAGGIIMTKDIATAGFPDFDRDDNEDGLTDFRGLGLVNFEFFPHYANSKRYEKALLKHSQETHRAIYACPDGSGVVVNGDEITFVGKVLCFHNGEKFQLRGK